MKSLTEIKKMLEEISPWKYCTSFEGDECHPDAEVFTISKYPTYTGWETDSGCSGYGLTKKVAEAFAQAPEIISQLVGEVEKLDSDNVELEKIILNLTGSNSNLQSENSQLRLELLTAQAQVTAAQIDEAQLERINEKLKSDNAVMQEALEFYADKDMYHAPNDDSGDGVPVFEDEGQVAQEALKQVSKEEKVGVE